MATDVSIVLSMLDKVSPTLKSIAGNTEAFDKRLDELEAGLQAYVYTYNTYTDVAGHTHGQLAAYTHQELREEVLS